GVHQRLNENHGLAGQEIKGGFLRASRLARKNPFLPPRARAIFKGVYVINYYWWLFGMVAFLALGYTVMDIRKNRINKVKLVQRGLILAVILLLALNKSGILSLW
ncbi:MAG: hypothetical protein JXA21_08505, partial [Anaerolineae bacterium]|nr:hypothetical protein [Anaerolineae bacterium]